MHSYSPIAPQTINNNNIKYKKYNQRSLMIVPLLALNIVLESDGHSHLM